MKKQKQKNESNLETQCTVYGTPKVQSPYPLPPSLSSTASQENFSYMFKMFAFFPGTGTLGVPFAVMQGGYMSLLAIVLISVITNYTGKLIIECLYEKPFNDQGTRGVRLRNSYALIGELVSSTDCLL